MRSRGGVGVPSLLAQGAGGEELTDVNLAGITPETLQAIYQYFIPSAVRGFTFLVGMASGIAAGLGFIEGMNS